MRIVKLSSLSEKERKKVLEEQEERYQQNQQERQRIQKQANDDFVNAFGNGDTNPSHTTTYKEILNSMQNKQQIRDFKKANRLTLWDQIKDIAGALENIGLGANNGIKSSQQTIGRTLSNGLTDRMASVNKTNEYLLNNAKDEKVKKKAQAMLDNTNSIISIERMNENTQNAYNQLQEKKNQNSKRIQENIEKQDSSVLKKIAEINPSIGQMLPGMMGGPLGTTYFMTSASGNYYDDAKQRGMNEEQASIYSSIMGIIEGATESIGAKLTTNVGKQLLRKNIKGALINYGLDIGENFLEESIVEPISELVAQTTAGKDKANWDNMKGRMIQSGIDGALTAVITGSVSGAVGNIGANIQDNIENKKANKNADYWIDKAQQIVNENTDNKVINQENKMLQNQFSQADTTETLRQEARNKLESIKQNYDENSYNQMQEFIETAPSEKALNQVINDLNKESEQTPTKTENKSFEDVAFEAMSNYENNEVESPLKNRDMSTIGKQTNVNAYQYDNPKVKPYFQEMAQQMGEDLAYISSSDNRSTQKGGGTKLNATTKAMDILHNEQGYSYNQIAQGLQNIIDDKGSENNAISKKIELVIDEQLRNGYTNALGKNIEPNQEYINAIQPNNENNTEYIKPYSQNDISYLSKGNNLIDGVNSDLKSFAEKYYDINTKMAKKKIAPVKAQKLFLGRINDKVSSYINSIINNSGRFNKKYDVTDSNIVIGSNNIEHFYNEHGNETNIEQIDVTPENISKYPEVVSSPDYIGLSDNLSRGNTPTVYMAKRINGYSVAVEVITNKKQMYPEAYYIYKSNSSEWDNFIKNHKLKEVENMGSNEFGNSLEQNVQDDMSVTSINNSISQNEQNVKSDNTNINNMQDNQENMQQFSMSEQQKQNNFEYKESKNFKVDTFRKDASKYWDNSEKTSKLVNTIEKVINDKGYNIRLNDTIGDNVNGKIVTNQQTGEIEITINPNSSRAGEFILGHELTHAIQTQEMVDLVNQRMQKDGDLRNAVEDLKKLYNTNEVNAEVLADISGQLFGNQEFINNLSVEKPNVFKRIYDKIVSLANKITGNSNEALFIKDLKNKWEQAYRENNNTINEEQYSIGGKKGMDNAIKSDPKYSLMRYYYNKAQQMAKQNIDNEQIRQQTNWFQDKNGDWKFEFSDRDMTLKSNIKLQDGKTYKLNDILEHDTLFEIYPELKDYNVKIKKMNTNVNGSFNKNTHTINLKKMKTRIATEGTLIHEIQHAIQDIEGFENGRSTKLSRLAYYQSLGEIEADNTKQRFLQEKRGNLNRNKTAPESSKINPKHRKLDNYIQNRTIIDKMKDGLYNYFDKIGLGGNISNENFEIDTENDIQNQEQDSRLVDGRRNLNENSEKSSFNLSENHKQKQNEIIQKNNPMDKTLGEHTWINSADDIKTYQEAIEEFGGIDNITPDFTAEDVKKALDTGKMTVYSSYPIEQGTFVTPSKMEAQSYAGKGQVYSKEISLTDVAWIDEVQGQYAKVEAQNNNTNITTDNQGRQLSEQQQEYFKNSKARDEQGNLLEVYHGTNNDFTIFDKSYLGTASGDVGFLGDGFYLATHKGEAGYYGSNVMSGYVDIKNPFNIKELNKYNGKVLEGEDSSIGVRIYNLVSMNEQWKDITIDGYSYEEIANETRNFLENAKIKKLGDIEDFSGNLTGIMWEINYKGNSKKTESIPNYKQEAILADSLNEHIRKKFGYINSQEILQNITHENRYNSNIKSFSEVLQDNGYDSIVQGTPQTTDEIVIFNSNQFKNIDNKTPTDNPDIRYSKQNNNWQDYLESNYKSEGTTTDLRDIRLPMKEKQEVRLPMKENIQQTQDNTQNTKGEAINWTEIERPEENRKFRKHYKSIIESDNTTAEAKSIAKELMGIDTYVPETNKGQLAQADQRIMTSSPEVELQSLLSRAMNGEKISSVDIAVGERLIQYFSKTGNKQQLQDAIQATAMAGTSAGQTVQALSMLNHQTPQGQATWIQRSVDKMNKELAKKKGGTITTDADGNLQVINKQGVDITDKVDLFNLTPEMIDKIMNSENQEQMYKNIDEVYGELGQQVPLGTLEKIDSWRYFSMLANARTHIRNMVGNLAMGKTQRIKDKLAGGIEDVVSKFNPKMERTKTLAFADKKTKDFAKQDFKNMEVQSRLELNENKYNPQSRLQNARRTFKSNAMENTLGRVFNLNDKLLSAEDGIGLKAGYQKALADYITANKIDVDNITDAQLNKARNYAVQQAKEATFHQANAIASAVAQFENKNLATKLFTGAVLPFKKTPMNVAKAGMEYSPLQIAKSATVDLVNLRKGNISVNQYIDNLSKGMTGTGIALVGYALANAGILKASGGDDKDKEKYEEEQGKQSYSIQIAGKTYSLDWLAPTGIPLFIGAETHKLFNQEETEKSTEKKSEEDRLNQAIKGASNLLNAGATAINPMSEMSMISGLTSALSSYNTSDNLGSLGNIMTNAGKSYVNQFFPTLMGQVAKTTDKYERTTKSTATGTIGKAVDQTINQIKNKVPGLRQTLPIKTDIWGKEVKQEVNLPLRAVNNFINPATVKEVSTDKVDMELNKLYEENHSSSLLPDILTKTVQLNKQTYRLSNKEYAEFTKNYGQTSHKLIENFIKTSDYNKLTQEQKETAISNIYSYAKEQNKMDYAKKVNETVKPSTLYTTMKEIEKNGGKQSEYLSYLAKTKGISKENEKNKVLADSTYSNKTKEIIYTNGTGKDDNLYNNLLSKSNINMTEYLKYKDKLSEKAFSADKDKNGKTIAGSAKAKTINYLNNNITGVGNRLLIAGKSYALQNSEKQKLAEYINQIANTKEDRINIYKQLDKNFYVRNEKVYMRVSK